MDVYYASNLLQATPGMSNGFREVDACEVGDGLVFKGFFMSCTRFLFWFYLFLCG